MPPPPGCPDWAYPGMLLYTHFQRERYIINAIELDAEGGFRANVQLLRTLPNGESAIDDSGNRWPRGGRWYDEGALAHNFRHIGYFDRISPYPRFRQEPRRSSLNDAIEAMRAFGSALGDIGQVISVPEVPKPLPRTAFERILDEEDD